MSKNEIDELISGQEIPKIRAESAEPTPIAPETEVIDSQSTGMDALAEKIAVRAGIVDGQGVANAAAMRAVQLRNAAVKKAQEAQKKISTVKWLLWATTVVLILGGLYVAYYVVNKATKGGVDKISRKLTGHSNGYR